jgi:hypothetical protein
VGPRGKRCRSFAATVRSPNLSCSKQMQIIQTHNYIYHVLPVSRHRCSDQRCNSRLAGDPSPSAAQPSRMRTSQLGQWAPQTQAIGDACVLLHQPRAKLQLVAPSAPALLLRCCLELRTARPQAGWAAARYDASQITRAFLRIIMPIGTVDTPDHASREELSVTVDARTRWAPPWGARASLSASLRGCLLATKQTRLACLDGQVTR